MPSIDDSLLPLLSSTASSRDTAAPLSFQMPPSFAFHSLLKPTLPGHFNLWSPANPPQGVHSLSFFSSFLGHADAKLCKEPRSLERPLTLEEDREVAMVLLGGSCQMP